MRAERADLLRLLGRGGLRDHKRAGEPRELHRMHAEPAARAGDQRALARRELSHLAHRIQDRADRAGDDRGVLQRDALGHQRDVIVLDRDVFRIAADHAGIAGELAVGTQRLLPHAAMPARAADVIALHGRDLVAGLEAAHVAAGIDHRAGDLVTQNHRHLHAVLQGAVARDDVVEAHAAGIDLDDDVLRPRRRVGDRLHLEHVGAARRPHHHRFHLMIPSA